MLTKKSTFIYFDDYCYLCSNTIRILGVMDWKKKLEFCGLNSENGKSLLAAAPAHILNSDSIIVKHEEAFYSKSKAIFKIFQSLGGGFQIFLIFRIIPAKHLDKVYDSVARIRYRIFGKRKSCYLPKK